MAPNTQQKVYVIQHQLGPVKIGIAQDPKHRLSELQVSCPFDLKIKKTRSTPHAKEVEKFLHVHFRRYHLRGEWFDIPKDQRDFEIPTKIKSTGRPNVDVELSPEREMNAEWARTLERLVNAMKETKQLTIKIGELREEWRTHLPQNPDEDDAETGIATDISDVAEDTPEEMVQCGQCGHHYDRSEECCPTCSSGDSFDRYEYR